MDEDILEILNSSIQKIIVDVTPNLDNYQKNNPNEEIQNDDPIQLLKLQLDSLNQQINVYRTIFRSIERFRKCCSSASSVGDGSIVGGGGEQFQNEYNKFNLNYLRCRKRIRKIKKQTRLSSLPLSSLSSSNPYDILYDLYQCKISISEKVENANQPTTNIIPKSEDQPTTIQQNFQCFVNGCGQMFTLKSNYLEHLFGHSVDVDQPVTIKTLTKPANKKNKKQQNGIVRIVTRKTRNRAVKTKSMLKKVAEKEIKVVVSKRKPPGRQTSAPKEQKPRNKELPRKAKKVNRKKSSKKGNKSINGKNKKKNLVVVVDETPQVFNCEFDDCKFVGKTKWSLKSHLVSHSDIRPFKCDNCEKSFKFKGLLKAHQRGVHEGQRHECPFEGCDVRFANGNRLRQHVQIAHTKDPPVFRCSAEGCSYFTLKVEFLKKHSAVHSDERPYKCMWPGCGKAFKLSNTRIDHLLMHKNERGFKCKFPDCSYACNTYNNLLKHHAIHEKKLMKVAKINNIDLQPEDLQNQQLNQLINEQQQQQLNRMVTEVAMTFR